MQLYNCSTDVANMTKRDIRNKVRSSKSSRTKPKGLPALGEQLPSNQVEDQYGSRTPYRLPRISAPVLPPTSYMDVNCNNVWSKCGYQMNKNKYNLAYPRSPVDTAFPSLAMQDELYRNHISQPNPKISSAVITPMPRSISNALYRHSPKLHKEKYGQFAYHGSFVYPPSRHPIYAQDDIPYEYGPVPSPVSRGVSAAKSTRSIHWALSPYKNQNFDKQGQTKVQGPYSREFVVSCSAPNSWMMLKLGRSRIVQSY